MRWKHLVDEDETEKKDDDAVVNPMAEFRQVSKPPAPVSNWVSRVLISLRVDATPLVRTEEAVSRTKAAALGLVRSSGQGSPSGYSRSGTLVLQNFRERKREREDVAICVLNSVREFDSRHAREAVLSYLGPFIQARLPLSKAESLLVGLADIQGVQGGRLGHLLLVTGLLTPSEELGDVYYEHRNFEQAWGIYRAFHVPDKLLNVLIATERYPQAVRMCVEFGYDLADLVRRAEKLFSRAVAMALALAAAREQGLRSDLDSVVSALGLPRNGDWNPRRIIARASEAFEKENSTGADDDQGVSAGGGGGSGGGSSTGD